MSVKRASTVVSLNNKVKLFGSYLGFSRVCQVIFLTGLWCFVVVKIKSKNQAKFQKNMSDAKVQSTGKIKIEIKISREEVEMICTSTGCKGHILILYHRK